MLDILCRRPPPGAMTSLAVVCGGSRGIGQAVSRLLAQRGCRVAVVSRNEDAARATVASLHGGTGNPVCISHSLSVKHSHK